MAKPNDPKGKSGPQSYEPTVESVEAKLEQETPASLQPSIS